MLHDPTKVDPTYANAYRGIMDARRMLRKSDQRHKQFVDACEIADASDRFTGPMRGTVLHATTLGMQVIYRDNQILLITPFGGEINLCTDQETHLRSCLREAARYSALLSLQQRIDITDKTRTKGKRGRKDMQGITAYVDLQAT